ncbi:MAG TPA: hypothetical protein VJU79_09905 [Candidatus Dormibacteraeota bacterium]|nr:hypothetical protein [Candidatus Dormibacteraeota bacterium]
MSIEGAIGEMQAARTRSRVRAEQRREQRRQLLRLERMVERMEAKNLARDRKVPVELWDELTELDHRLPVPAPAALWKARTTVHIHGALLDWEGALLDRVAPQRDEYEDRHD